MQLGRREFLGGAAATGLTAFAAPSRAGGVLDIVATTSMIADAARRIGGPQVRVRALMGPGVDPHSYRQTRTDIAALMRADLVLWHGLYLEAQMEEFLLRLGGRRHVVAVAEVLPKDRLIAAANYANRFDPHVWMDPVLWSDVVAGIGRTLAEAAPAGAAVFAERSAAHLQEIAALDAYANRVLATVPREKRVLFTSHDAFSYFGRAYGFEVEGIQGISTESEAGVNRIAELVERIVASEVPAVFVESSVSDRNMRALVEGARAKGHEVAIGGELFSDAMGEEGSYEGTYLGMIDHNVTTIARALGGDAPALGMAGRLSAGG